MKGINTLAYGHKDITKQHISIEHVEDTEEQQDAIDVDIEATEEDVQQPISHIIDDEEDDEEFPCGIEPRRSMLNKHAFLYSVKNINLV